MFSFFICLSLLLAFLQSHIYAKIQSPANESKTTDDPEFGMKYPEKNVLHQNLIYRRSLEEVTELSLLQMWSIYSGTRF